MKLILAVSTVMISAAALARETSVPGCKLISDGNGTRVWQCAPTPSSGANVNSGSAGK